MTSMAQDWAALTHRRQFRADAEDAAAQALMLRIHPEVLLALLDALEAAERLEPPAAVARAEAGTAPPHILHDQIDRLIDLAGGHEARIAALEAAEDARVRGVPRTRQGESR